MYAVTHPSEPNYAAVVGGDYYGIGDDALHMIPSQVATVVEILEEKGISWAEYQEDMPYSGFTGFNYTNPSNNYVDYVRKHNPLVFLLRCELTADSVRFCRHQCLPCCKHQKLYPLSERPCCWQASTMVEPVLFCTDCRAFFTPNMGIIAVRLN